METEKEDTKSNFRSGNGYHTPVLVDEVIQHMNLKPNGIYVDCTLGGGGHSLALLQNMPSITVFGLDRDEQAIQQGKKTLINFQNKVVLIKDNYKNLKTSLALNKINKVDGILMDIGVSNYQLSNEKRGFSFMTDCPLDMRMDSMQPMNATEVVNNYSQKDLTDIFFAFGEENYSKKIAENIIKQRDIAPIITTKELSDIIELSIPAKDKKNMIKSKARIFQAIRIEVNAELDALNTGLKDAISLLNTGGRILIISWHSLEDRIVKTIFKQAEGQCTCPPEIPVCLCNIKKKLRIISKKPIIPTDKEIATNPNAKSAKLRVAEKI